MHRVDISGLDANHCLNHEAEDGGDLARDPWFAGDGGQVPRDGEKSGDDRRLSAGMSLRSSSLASSLAAQMG